MQLFSGLYSYEIVLLILGTVMFAVLLSALIYQLLKGRSLIQLGTLFIVPVVMIGFPGISTINIKNGLFTIATRARELEQHPDDKTARAELEKAVQEVARRPHSDPQALTTIAQAEFVLGRTEQAQMTAEKALQADPRNRTAAQIKDQAAASQELPKAIKQAEQHPDDANAKAELEKKVNVVTQRPVADPVILSRVAQAQKAIGETDKAQATAQKAVRIDPNLRLKLDPKLLETVKQK